MAHHHNVYLQYMESSEVVLEDFHDELEANGIPCLLIVQKEKGGEYKGEKRTPQLLAFSWIYYWQVA